MSIYLDKLAHVQVIINCQYSIAQMCTHEDTLPQNLGAPYFDDVKSYNSLTTLLFLFLQELDMVVSVKEATHSRLQVTLFSILVQGG